MDSIELQLIFFIFSRAFQTCKVLSDQMSGSKARWHNRLKKAIFPSIFLCMNMQKFDFRPESLGLHIINETVKHFRYVYQVKTAEKVHGASKITFCGNIYGVIQKTGWIKDPVTGPASDLLPPQVEIALLSVVLLSNLTR